MNKKFKVFIRPNELKPMIFVGAYDTLEEAKERVARSFVNLGDLNYWSEDIDNKNVLAFTREFSVSDKLGQIERDL